MLYEVITLRDIRGQRGATGDEELHATAGALLQLGEHQPVRELLLQREPPGDRQAGEGVIGPFLADPLGPEEDSYNFV